MRELFRFVLLSVVTAFFCECRAEAETPKVAPVTSVRIALDDDSDSPPALDAAGNAYLASGNRYAYTSGGVPYVARLGLKISALRPNGGRLWKVDLPISGLAQSILAPGTNGVWVAVHRVTWDTPDPWDAMLVRLDRAGRLEWAVSWTGATNALDSPRGLAVAPSGEAYLLVLSSDYDRPTQTYLRHYYSLLKFNTAGQLLWTQPVDAAQSIIAHPAGGVVLSSPSALTAYDENGSTRWSWAGNTRPPMRFDPQGRLLVPSLVVTPGYWAPTNGIRLLRFSVNGALDWVSDRTLTVVEGHDDYGVSVGCDAAGNAFLAGDQVLQVVTTYTEDGYDHDYVTQPFVIKFDAQGHEQWIWNAPGQTSNYRSFASLSVASNGNAFMTWNAITGGDKSLAQLAVIAPDGNRFWGGQYRPRGTQSTRVINAQLDNKNNLVVWAELTRGQTSTSSYLARFKPKATTRPPR